MARTLAGDFRRFHERVRSRVQPTLRDAQRWWAAEVSPRARTLRSSVPWRRVLALAVVLSLVAMAVPALRWPFLRAVATTATSLSGPMRPGVDGFDTLARSTKVLDRNGDLIAELDAGERRIPAAIAHLPEHVVHAVLAAEDRNFYEHPGLDPTALVRAAAAQAQGGRQGGSTITQQLAKLNFTGNAPTLIRKIEEAGYAAELERKFTKDELLERYLNQVYFGDGAYGIGAAAQAFFGLEPTQLSPAQAAMLAGKIRAPDRLDPDDDPDAVLQRRNQVLSLMADEGWLSGADAEAARAEPLGIERARAVRPPSRAPWFVEFVKKEAKGLGVLGQDAQTRMHRLLTGGYTVETTLDVAATEIASQKVKEHLDRPDDPSAAVVSVEPGTGAIRIMVGGRDFAQQRFNAAVQARRQPGSAFKPFVYLAALQEGIDPRSTLGGWSPREFEFEGREFEINNYGKRSYGRITIDDALVRSVNTAFMELGLEVEPRRAVEQAQHAGLKEDFSPVPAVALGGINPGVTPLQMAGAYATFAAGGVHADPYSIARIRDPGGRVVYEAEPERRLALDRNHVHVLNRALLDVVESGTGRAAALPDRQVAGKTGTTSDHRDAWFIGYVPQLATAVWTGYLDNSPMRSVHGRAVSGGSFPALIFGEVMEAALAGMEPEPIPVVEPSELDLELRRPKRTRPATTAPPPPPPETSTTSTSSSSSTTTTAPPPPSTEPTSPPEPSDSGSGASGSGAGEDTTTTTASTTTTTAPAG